MPIEFTNAWYTVDEAWPLLSKYGEEYVLVQDIYGSIESALARLKSDSRISNKRGSSFRLEFYDPHDYGTGYSMLRQETISYWSPYPFPTHQLERYIADAL